MRINLTDGYFITEDYGSSVALKREREGVKKETKEKYIAEDIIGYYRNVESAVLECIKLLSIERTSESATLKEYLENQRSINDELRELLGR